MSRARVDAVLFDLDDTLYPQQQWLAGAWAAVAAAAARLGAPDPRALEQVLLAVAARGSAQGGIIDQALARVGLTGLPVQPLVAAFQAHAPRRLEPYPGVREALHRLSRSVPLGLISDGHVAGQRAKLAALGLAPLLQVVVWSDALGREHRKPDPAPFLAALAALGVDAAHAVYVGDNPAKDVRGAQAVGLRAVRVATGEHRGAPDVPAPWRRAPNAATAVALLEPLIRRGSAAPGARPRPLMTPKSA